MEQEFDPLELVLDVLTADLRKALELLHLFLELLVGEFRLVLLLSQELVQLILGLYLPLRQRRPLVDHSGVDYLLYLSASLRLLFFRLLDPPLLQATCFVLQIGSGFDLHSLPWRLDRLVGSLARVSGSR